MSRVIVDANLSRLGIKGDRVAVARDDVLRGKPAPEPYLRAATLLGVSPAETAVVEDSATGLAAGLAAGMTVFMMSHYSGRRDDRWQPVSDLKDIVARTLAVT